MMARPVSLKPVSRPSARRSHELLAGVAMLALLSGCASTQGGGVARYDPLERINRPIFTFNDTLDRYALRPVARFYSTYFPQPFQLIVRNFFSNLEDVGTTANQLLQGKPGLALNDAARVVVNSTLGLAGAGDPASAMGLRKHHEDFGQTLGRWGVPFGPYLMLPFMGPSSLRDGPARFVNAYADPVFWPNEVATRNVAWGLRTIDDRAGLLPREKMLDGITLDRYSIIRDGYLQMRLNAIHDGDVPDGAARWQLPGFGDDQRGAPGAGPTPAPADGGASGGSDDFDPGPSGGAGPPDGRGSQSLSPATGGAGESDDPGPTPPSR